MEITEFRDQASAISAAAKQIKGAIHRHLSAIQSAQATKAAAKTDHERAFDRGDADGMQRALAAIQEANQACDRAVTALQGEGLRQQIAELQKRHEALAEEAAPIVATAQAVWKAAEDAVYEAKRCRDSSSSLNYELAELVQCLTKAAHKARTETEQPVAAG